MPFIPLPFVVALLLLLLLATVLRRDEGVSRRLTLIVLIVISIWQSVRSGLRWGYDVQAMVFLAPVGPALVPPLAYAGVENLVRGKRPWGWLRYGVHGLPAMTIVLLLVLAREAIDVALIAIFVGYALAILRLMRPGTDALRLAPFEGAAPAYRASLFTALCLLLSAAVDLFVVLDLAWAQGAYVRPVIAIANLCLLVILSIAAASTGAPPERVSVMPSAPDVPAPDVSSSERAAPEAATAEDAGTMDAIERLMQTKRVYRDVDLNLDRLARKAGIARSPPPSTGQPERMSRKRPIATTGIAR
ncbi:AraC family transcriptional regulator [Rhizobium sp. Leaf371]|uniref:AraC family transcriptional regulator n=1 Tax=Rhizobium sp. Leaf371 TaxID=1736355 RepID=UPI000A6C2D19|nr:AraC family transcriptional regulator [Rhizobium sp. Leaf371]